MKLRPYQNEAKNAVISSELGQVILPTGTGKSVIQGAVIEYHAKITEGFGIYVILTPRIMLTNQLMRDVANQLIKSGITISALTIHSGKPAEFYDENADDYTMWIYSNVGNKSTTHTDDVVVAIKDAQAFDKPLLICCTYDSAPTLTRALIQLELNADQVLCDEAHYIVEKQFNKNVADLQVFSDRMHFFTATQKVTKGDAGNGMNNTSFYGSVVFRRSPRQMIDQGYMVRPRIHYEKAEANAPWSKMISDAYIKHSELVSYNAKMLVCCNGTKTIKEVISTPGFNEWCREQSITVFAITSATGALINGVQYDRMPFLDKLRAHEGKAIILHINILTEGIDIPDITSVMFIRNMGTTRFLQSLGRATRVLPCDLGKPTDDFDVNAALWKKPYAYAIISEKDDENEGKTSSLRTIIEEMRCAGFEPTEDVVIAIDRGTGTEEEFDPANVKDKNTISNFADFFEILHEIEVEKLAALSEEEFFKVCPI